MLDPESVMPNPVLNLIQYCFGIFSGQTWLSILGGGSQVTNSMTYVTLKQPTKQVQGKVQGDRPGLFTNSSPICFINSSLTVTRLHKICSTNIVQGGFLN